MNRRPLVRTLLASAAIAAAIALGGCETDGTAPSARALKPLSDKMLAEVERKKMPKESPILVRIFKQESELEVWKQDASGRFALLKSYPICRWSGELGPKIKEGDRQAPEGFYTITPGQMNPHSQYYLAFNLGYPNDFDRAHNRTGAHLMVHGDCSSRGCYAMTDEQIEEIYALGRESFFGGQRAFQVQAYPFRMTPANMAKHRNNPHMAFWKMLKAGNDHFEVTRREPKVDVCEKRYVFNASTAHAFNPAGKCPVYEVPEEILAGVNEKQRRDEIQIAELSRSTKTAPITTGTDGGMHPVFLAKLNPPPIRDSEGHISGYAEVSAPGTIPAHVNPPSTPGAATGSVAPPSPPPQAKPAPQPARVAAAQPTIARDASLFSAKPKPQSDNMLDRVTSTVSGWLGLRGSEPSPPTPAPAVRAANAAPAGAIRPKPQDHSNADRPKANAGAIQAQPKQETAAAEPPVRTAAQAPSASLLNGAQPIMPTASFESRWGGLR